MLDLCEQGVSNGVIAQRMGLTVTSVRNRIKRARDRRDRDAGAASGTSGKGFEDLA